MIKKLVNILLILILAIQVLPVQLIGAALFNNQFTEEAHSMDVEKDCIKKMQGKSDFIDWTNETISIATFITLQQTIIQAATIPHNHSTEILVPPPNC